MGSYDTGLEFLKEIDFASSSNIGSYINGQWKITGSSITYVNPSNNQVHLLIIFFLISSVNRSWLLLIIGDLKLEYCSSD